MPLDLKPMNIKCEFLGGLSTSNFKPGELLNYQVDAPNSIWVFRSKSDTDGCWFTASDFDKHFRKVEPATVKEVFENKGVCVRTANSNNFYKKDERYYFTYDDNYFTVQTEQQGEVADFDVNRFFELFTIVDAANAYAAKPEPVDMVNNPPHYKGSNGIESIDVIKNFGLNFNTGNAVKYILRAGRKDITKHKEDLQKAIWYLNRELSYLD